MDIGKEAEQPVEYPIPVDPAKRKAPRREEVPVKTPAEAPVEEPAHARALEDAREHQWALFMEAHRG